MKGSAEAATGIELFIVVLFKNPKAIFLALLHAMIFLALM
jgi:hypothetical protein